MHSKIKSREERVWDCARELAASTLPLDQTQLNHVLRTPSKSFFGHYFSDPAEALLVFQRAQVIRKIDDFFSQPLAGYDAAYSSDSEKEKLVSDAAKNAGPGGGTPIV